MRVRAVELLTLRMPLVTPFTTSFSTQTERFPLLVRVLAETDGREVDGWGECVALTDLVYSSEYLDSAREVLRRYLVPAVFAAQAREAVTADGFAESVRHILGHRMAKAALEMALLDAELRLAGVSFGERLGATTASVPSGVSVGIHDSIDALLGSVGDYLDQGYVRIKLKIRPGWDVEPVRAVRDRFGDIPLQVDANTAYTLADAEHLRLLDAYDLLLIEQPLGEDDIREHALLARRMRTPMCLDESIVSTDAARDAIERGAAAIINIKAGRVGGYLAAVRIHDLAREAGVPVWCGGMLETGLGRAANTALAGLPGFTLPGDISASARFFAQDITEPFVLQDGRIRIPAGPGLGVEPLPDALEEFSQHALTLEAEHPPRPRAARERDAGPS
ncbi:o-succinylbenzoate synthase [Glaciibacter flavus]|uniref:o-succinylbenzoate synthase n=1 Tax=Orlajensenia flava TaxID=2565934 RepID=A0A4S4FVK3_9MICO|nr:o-succinylbenzoate synthase [Glaciibacter flavus]THG33895.1 o-succinylbenzoate synthase [Glaciibacter flavus]